MKTPKTSAPPRRSRYFGALKLWLAGRVMEEAKSAESSEGGRGPAVQKAQSAQTRQANTANAAAKMHAVHTPKLKLEAAPHPTDAFMKGGGI